MALTNFFLPRWIALTDVVRVLEVVVVEVRRAAISKIEALGLPAISDTL